MADNENTGVEVPEDLTTLDAKILSGLKTQVAKEFGTLQKKKGVDAEDLERMTALRDYMVSIRAEETSRAEAQAVIDEEAAKIVAEMAGDEADKAPTIAEAAGAAEEEGATVTDINAGNGEETVEVTAETAEAETTEAAESVTVEGLAAALVAALRSPTHTGPVTTSPRASIADAAQAKAESTSVSNGSNLAIVAAAGIDRVEMGSHLDRDGLSTALHEKARMLPNQAGSGGRGALVASISPVTPRNDIRGIEGDEELRIAFNAAHSVPEEGLVASGGWCAPSETVYDFVCDYESMPEMVDVPTMTASNRGGVRYPTSPTLSAVFDDINSGFTWTEADDIAAAAPGGPTKPCFTIPCPEFLETRLQAQGICVTAGNLTDRAYPELTNRYVDLVLTAHAHRMNGLKIAQMVTNSTPVAPTVTDLSAAEAILAGIELQIACLRDEFFMSADFVLEVVLPRWVRTVIRRDLARRAGVDFRNVSNAEIAQFFTEIGARVQFVSNYQSLRGVADPGCITLPPSVNALIYPAGAHTVLDGGSLDLGVVRDSTLNATNDYTAAWSEEFWALISRCVSLDVTIPLCPNGSTGSPVTIACPTA